MKNIFSLIAVILLAASASKITQAQDGKQAGGVIDSLYKIGLERYNRGEYYESVDAFKDVLRFIEETDTVADNTYYTTSASNIGNIYNYNLGNYKEAIKYYLQVLAIQELTLGKQDASYAETLCDIAVAYRYIDEYDKALEYHKQALSIRKETLGEQHIDYATSLNNIGVIYSATGNYAEALIYYEQVLKILEETTGVYDANYSLLLNNITTIHYALGNYKEAVLYSKQALAIQREVIGEHHLDYAISLTNIGELCKHYGNYAECLDYLLQALSIRRELLGEQHPKYAESLSSIGEVYSNLGNFDKALEHLQQALENQHTTIGERHTEYAQTLNHLGKVYNDMGHFEEALSHHQNALYIYRDIFGKHDINYILSLNSIGGIYYSLNNFEEALKSYKEAYALGSEKFGERHASYAMISNNLGLIYDSMGEHEKAILYYEQAMAVFEDIFGIYHPDYSNMLINLGSTHSYLGNYERALVYFSHALDITKETIGQHTTDYATSLNNIGATYFSVHDYDTALSYYNQALEIQEEVLSKQHPNYTTLLGNISATHLHKGDHTLASDTYSQLLPLLKAATLSNFKFLTEAQRTIYWKQHEKYIFLALSILDNSELHNTASTTLAYDAALLSKGLILSSSIELRKVILESGSSELLEIYDTAQYIDTKLLGEGVSATERDSLSLISNQLNSTLMERSKEFGDFTRNLAIGCKEVQDKLGDSDVAIEFVNYSLINGKDEDIYYAALVLRKEMEHPIMVSLTTEAKLTHEMRNKEKIYQGYNSKLLYKEIWAKLEQYLNEGDEVYFSPSGLLHQLNIELFTDSGGTPAGELYNLHRLSSTRQICYDNEELEGGSAALYGGLKYSMDTLEMAVHSRKWDNKRAKSRSITPLRGVADGDDLTLGELKASKDEVEYIAEKMDDAGMAATKYIEFAGNEESFKALSGEKTPIIHIATHGFFLENEQSHKHSYLQLMSSNNTSADNSMKRSGLMLAGAQKAWRGEHIPEGVEDGILLSEEISTLDLRGTKLVVLSCCETGLGDITSEGVFGLQRAFKMAGVETIIMSLWKVDDEATSLMMQTFYDTLLSGETKRDSFIIAQKRVKESYSNPHFWAAFIMLD